MRMLKQNPMTRMTTEPPSPTWGKRKQPITESDKGGQQ